MVLEKLETHMQKNETELLSYTTTKMNSKWIKVLNVSPKTIKVPEENIDISLANDILGLIPETKATKAKINQ